MPIPLYRKIPLNLNLRNIPLGAHCNRILINFSLILCMGYTCYSVLMSIFRGPILGAGSGEWLEAISASRIQLEKSFDEPRRTLIVCGYFFSILFSTNPRGSSYIRRASMQRKIYGNPMRSSDEEIVNLRARRGVNQLAPCCQSLPY